MAPNPSRVRTSAKPAPKAAPKRADLRVVRTDDRVRTVGAISSAVAAFFFLVMFALAGLHAVVVQTQSELDTVNREISHLEEVRIVALADLAYSGSAIGVEATALAAGFVPAARQVNLPLVPPGQLEPPASGDPFAASIETVE
jgi:hypothetical protein